MKNSSFPSVILHIYIDCEFYSFLCCDNRVYISEICDDNKLNTSGEELQYCVQGGCGPHQRGEQELKNLRQVPRGAGPSLTDPTEVPVSGFNQGFTKLSRVFWAAPEL